MGLFQLLVAWVMDGHCLQDHLVEVCPLQRGAAHQPQCSKATEHHRHLVHRQVVMVVHPLLVLHTGVVMGVLPHRDQNLQVTVVLLHLKVRKDNLLGLLILTTHSHHLNGVHLHRRAKLYKQEGKFNGFLWPSLSPDQI